MTDQHIDILENSCKYNYHTTSGFPKTIVLPAKKLRLSYTKHAHAMAKKRFWKPILPEVVEITWKNLIEIHTNDNINILKAVVKLPHNSKNDMILVLELLKTKARVITVYRNAKNHSFETLNKKFDIPIIPTPCVYVGKDIEPLPSIHIQTDVMQHFFDDLGEVIELTATLSNDQELGEAIRNKLRPYVIMRQHVINSLP